MQTLRPYKVSPIVSNRDSLRRIIRYSDNMLKFRKAWNRAYFIQLTLRDLCKDNVSECSYATLKKTNNMFHDIIFCSKFAQAANKFKRNSTKLLEIRFFRRLNASL